MKWIETPKGRRLLTKPIRGGRVDVTFGLVALAALLLAAPADAAPKPNLSVRSLAKPPAEVEAGKKFPLKVTVANGGPGSAKPSSVGFYLGWDDQLEFGKVASLGKLATPKLARGKSKKGKPKLKVPADAPLGEPLLLVACADDTSKVLESKEDDNCRAASDPLVANVPLDAIGLIELEYDEGDIDLDEAALFLAYASTGDPRLPGRFGDAAETYDSDALRKVAANWNDLTAQTQADLDPFFSPPIYREGSRRSAGARRGPLDPGCVPGAGLPPVPSEDWDSIDTALFRIWYVVDDAQSHAAATAVAAAADNVYDYETTLWRVPISDAGQPCNGGDGRTDVYMKGLGGAKAQVIPFPPGETSRPAWVWMNPGSFSGNGYRDGFAHEFAHVIQLAYDYAKGPPPGFAGNLEYGWLEEATATWAIDFVYPDDNYEHEFAADYYSRRAWGTPLGECRVVGCGNGYRDYLYFFYLVNKLGDHTVMADIYSNTESMGSIEAVDGAAAFEDEWAEFALHNLNQGDYNDYSTWDPGLNFKLPVDDGSEKPHLDVKLHGLGTWKTPLPDADSLLPKEYDWVSFSFDDAVRKITLRDFGWGSNPPPPAEAKVMAWYELANGDFETEDLTGEDEKTFCFENEDEDIERLVLFYANGKPAPFLTDTDLADHPKPDGEIEANAACEWRPYSGSFSGTAAYTPAQIGGTINASWSGTVGLEPYDTEPPSGQGNYRVTSGALNYSFSGRIGGCDVSGSAAVGLPTFDMVPTNAMTIIPGDPDTYQLTIQIPIGEQADGTRSNCEEPEDEGEPFDFGMAAGFPAMVASSDPADGFNPLPVPANRVLSGSASGGGDGGTPAQTWTWNLSPG